MANANLTQAEIDALIADLNYYKYLAAFGSSSLGPLASAPQVEADVETKETTLYETGDEVQAEIISKNNVQITIETRNLAVAMPLLEAFRKGDNLLDSSNAKVLTLVPITDVATAKAITFPRAFLRPGLSMILSEGDDTPSSVKLVFTCKPDTTAGDTLGKPFVYAVAS